MYVPTWAVFVSVSVHDAFPVPIHPSRNKTWVPFMMIFC